jgi:hypothetical protein
MAAGFTSNATKRVSERKKKKIAMKQLSMWGII